MLGGEGLDLLRLGDRWVALVLQLSFPLNFKDTKTGITVMVMAMSNLRVSVWEGSFLLNWSGFFGGLVCVCFG